MYMYISVVVYLISVVLQVFFRAGALAQLEDSRDEKISDIVGGIPGLRSRIPGTEKSKKTKGRTAIKS